MAGRRDCVKAGRAVGREAGREGVAGEGCRARDAGGGGCRESVGGVGDSGCECVDDGGGEGGGGNGCERAGGGDGGGSCCEDVTCDGGCREDGTCDGLRREGVTCDDGGCENVVGDGDDRKGGGCGRNVVGRVGLKVVGVVAGVNLLTVLGENLSLTFLACEAREGTWNVVVTGGP